MHRRTSLPLLYLAIAINIHQQFGTESFSYHNFNRTKIVLRNLAPDLHNTTIETATTAAVPTAAPNESFCSSNEPEFQPKTTAAMEQKLKDKMEDLRRGLLKTIPNQLIDASANSSNGNHADADVDKAADFLDTHSKKKEWKRNLQKFVALKEAFEALHPTNPKKNPPPDDFPLAKMEPLLGEEQKYACLLEEMLLADGPSGGNYGKAVEIYQEICNESDAVDDSDHPVLHRMAVAVALVHATPVVQTNPVEPSDDAEDVVDPIRRYLNYECAYLGGELDPSFGSLTTWELRFVVDGDEPDEISAWGRRTLKNLYPDHVLQRKPDWLYAAVVRSSIPYGSDRVKEDDPKQHKYQNILRNGGICGRRAFFGRFILRAFGIPTTARPSKGHAALCHWRPDNGEWCVNLGAGWGKGFTKTRYVKDVDFEAMTRARNHPQKYQTVKLAQWIGELFDEKRVYGIHSDKGKVRDQGILLDLQKKSEVGLWYRLSLRVQESILATHKSGVGWRKKICGSGMETSIDRASKQKSKSGSCRCRTDGAIVVPGSSYSNPKKTKHVTIMKEIGDDDDDGACVRENETGSNQQIYLPPFKPEGTTILRGGTYKDEARGYCNSSARLLSDGKGKYDDWGLRVAMTLDHGDDDDDEGSCPEPEITLSLNADDSVVIEFVYVPPGSFVMGGTNTKDGRFKCVEVPHHPVTLTRGFYMGKYPVTNEQYEVALQKGGKNKQKNKGDPKCPKGNIGVNDAVAFSKAASEATGANIRMPTEAEWEYSARGSTNGTSADAKWFFGSGSSLLDDYAWHKGNSGGGSHPVGLKRANPFGLYDIYGNVFERVSDTYLKEYYAAGKGEAMVDPKGPSQGTKSRFKYEIENVEESGEYKLTALVCTVNVGQHLRVSTTDEKNQEGTLLKLPYTLGDWRDSEPVSLNLQKGKNTLHFWRDAPPQYGVSIKEFVLTKPN